MKAWSIRAIITYYTLATHATKNENNFSESTVNLMLITIVTRAKEKQNKITAKTRISKIYEAEKVHLPSLPIYFAKHTTWHFPHLCLFNIFVTCWVVQWRRSTTRRVIGNPQVDCIFGFRPKHWRQLLIASFLPQVDLVFLSLTDGDKAPLPLATSRHFKAKLQCLMIFP